MSYYCKLCDRKLKPSSKYKHNKSKHYFGLDNRIIRRYIKLNPDFDRVNEIVNKYVIIYTKKYVTFDVYCLFKILTKTNNIEYIRLPQRPHMIYVYFLLSRLITNGINKRDKILSMRITFVSLKNFVTYIQYLKQEKLYVKLN